MLKEIRKFADNNSFSLGDIDYNEVPEGIFKNFLLCCKHFILFENKNPILNDILDMIEPKLENEEKTKFLNEDWSLDRTRVKQIYNLLIPMAFNILGVDKNICKAIRKDFNSWIALSHFERYELILTESGSTRDHYIHPILVFFVGFLILSRFRKKIYGDDTCLFKRELIFFFFSAILHDFGYPLEKYDPIMHEFFLNFLLVDFPFPSINFRNIIDKGHYRNTLNGLCKIIERKVKKDAQAKDVISIIYPLIFDKTDHGIISALSLIERLDNVIIQFETFLKSINIYQKIKDKINTDFYIKNIEKNEKFKKILKIWNKEVKAILDRNSMNTSIKATINTFTIIKSIFKKEVAIPCSLHNELFYLLSKQLNYKIKWDEERISFLLIFCDAIQDWGERSNEDGFEVKEINVTENGIEVIYNVKKADKIPFKIEELEKVKEALILNSNITFKIKMVKADNVIWQSCR